MNILGSQHTAGVSCVLVESPAFSESCSFGRMFPNQDADSRHCNSDIEHTLAICPYIEVLMAFSVRSTASDYVLGERG
jgi:hypothetical protein